MGDFERSRLLDGRAGLVTGAGRGLGADLARAAAAAGAGVVVNDVVAETAEDTVASIVEAGGRAVAFVGDISDEDTVARLVQTVVASYGTIDFACNSAIPALEMQRVADLDLDYARRLTEVVLLGTAVCLKHELRAMQASGGSIVNITSTAGPRGQVETGIYSACKAGIEALTRVSANECGQYGIRVNAVQAGAMMTPALRQLVDVAPEVIARVVSGVPLGRIGDPTEVANAVVALLSDQCSYVTGAVLVADGGGVLHTSGLERRDG